MDQDRAGRSKEIPFSWVLRSRIVTKSTLEALFRVFGAKSVLPDAFYIRPLLVGSNFLDIREAISRIHSWEEWVGSWAAIGEKRETFARLAMEGSRSETARENFLFAAAAYHMAQLPLYEQPERKQDLYRKCAVCFRSASPLLSPPALPVVITHRGIDLPGYLRLPESRDRPPLLVLVPGVDGCKEEMHFFSEGLVRRGIGTLAYDGPGIGETWERRPMSVDDDGVATSLIEFLLRDGRVDPERIGLLGVSFGGNLAIRMAAAEERVHSVITLSAPYDLSSYGEFVLPVIQEQMKFLLRADSDAVYKEWARSFSVRGIVEKVRAPLLAIGGGEDTIIPGRDAKRIFEEAKGKKKLLFYEDGGHLCAEHAFDLVGKVEEWLIETGFQGGGSPPVPKA
jgi:2,6-dihydroxypseudooxynicotine hydrolase